MLPLSDVKNKTIGSLLILGSVLYLSFTSFIAGHGFHPLNILITIFLLVFGFVTIFKTEQKETTASQGKTAETAPDEISALQPTQKFKIFFDKEFSKPPEILEKYKDNVDKLKKFLDEEFSKVENEDADIEYLGKNKVCGYFYGETEELNLDGYKFKYLEDFDVYTLKQEEFFVRPDLLGTTIVSFYFFMKIYEINK